MCKKRCEKLKRLIKRIYWYLQIKPCSGFLVLGEDGTTRYFSINHSEMLLYYFGEKRVEIAELRYINNQMMFVIKLKEKQK